MSNARLTSSVAFGSSLTATSNRLGRNDSGFGSAAARLNMPPPCTQRRRSAPSLRRDVADETPLDDYVWDGTDEFEGLEDRRDLPPVALPPITGFREVVLIRHGQSTWNKAKRIQGSSNVSVLSEEGVRQAEVARDKLAGEDYDALYSSPLQRSARTAQIIWNGRGGAAVVLPSLREVDLYSFQGLIKAEGKQRYGKQYQTWQNSPGTFEIDGHAPVRCAGHPKETIVLHYECIWRLARLLHHDAQSYDKDQLRELWYRASLALHHVLEADAGPRALLVAHNAVNQAVLCVALGLPPARFRALVQSNAATSVLRFETSTGGTGCGDGVQATLLHLNQSPDVLAEVVAESSPAGCLRTLLVTAGGLSGKNAASTAATLAQVQVDRTVCDEEPAARALAEVVAIAQQSSQTLPPPPHLWNPLRGPDHGLRASAKQQAALVAAYCQFCFQSLPPDEGTTVVVVASADRGAALMHAFMGLPTGNGRWAVALQPGGISVVDIPWHAAMAAGRGQGDLSAVQATVHCMNNCSHLMAEFFQ